MFPGGIMNRSDRREVSAFAKRALGRKVLDIEYPGGKTRDSVRLILPAGRSVIATRGAFLPQAEHPPDVGAGEFGGIARTAGCL